MVVWGGYAGTALATGGRYDPAADAWSGVTMTGAPAARYNHTGVWTGQRFVVWGGGDGSAYLASGGRYDPASDTWAGVTSVGAPVARWNHAAVWAGDRVLVWGGYGGTHLATGGRYDPLLDTWASLASDGAPPARSNATAAWTGELMLVWGGQDGSGAVSTGGRYAPHAPDDADLDGLTECTGDCDDADADVYAGAPQVCDGRNNDCDHPAWPALAGTNEQDDDGDALAECAGDCDDAEATSWATPGEVTGVVLAHDPGGTLLAWQPPATGGTPAGMRYDTLRSAAANDFVTAAVCVESDAGPDTTAVEPASPPEGSAFFYLVRAQNACPQGQGPLGSGSDGVPRVGRECP
jgi:hypothetical protein